MQGREEEEGIGRKKSVKGRNEKGMIERVVRERKGTRGRGQEKRKEQK